MISYRVTSDAHPNSLGIMPSNENRIRLVENPEAAGGERQAVHRTLRVVGGIEVMHVECVVLYASKIDLNCHFSMDRNRTDLDIQ